MRNVGLYWFGNDLRLHDNDNLLKAASEVDALLCIYCLDLQWLMPNRYGLVTMSANRLRFLKESLLDLDKQLQQLGQHLLVCYETPVKAISDLASEHNVSHIFRSRQTGYYEIQQGLALRKQLPLIQFSETDTFSLFALAQLPFPLEKLPNTFTQFKNAVEQLLVDTPLPPVKFLPSSPVLKTDWLSRFPEYSKSTSKSEHEIIFHGGETAGLKQLTNYFASDNASQYKEQRNELDGWGNSSKFSPWLANGNLSIRQICFNLNNYEQQTGANESTYWLFFEVLWREYFQLYAYHHGKRLFTFKGIKQQKPLTSFYPERFRKWCSGNTPYALVNACMKQLNATGFMSNRGRQIVASCLVNELAVDWRYGAAYFEQQLLDYDVASNWGNWQYLAGVGADPRGKRHFDLEKQTQQYDPNAVFINKWQGGIQHLPLDSVDAADWPVAAG
ncbi:MAG: DASH family cryptochrome [Methylococcaceae bacterium]|nr:MAG: DASH family cryptochrome [Methylococcaceae bacterium]